MNHISRHGDAAYNRERYYDRGDGTENDKVSSIIMGGEAADGRANENRFRNEKEEQPEFKACQNPDYKKRNDEARDHEDDDTKLENRKI
ncbi:hypothetical protein F8M41_006962 [Gigaspora margarita]|uniref:Uncharacterized protein n=1 Tax=Gigaspora margarita TaxID=4874 RepID=A0A8H3X7H7_GIGMA|nr:hypothetical protein F8M41_006962 [Gigaspora margarita]